MKIVLKLVFSNKVPKMEKEKYSCILFLLLFQHSSFKFFFKKLVFSHSIILIIYKDNHKFHRTRAFESSGVGDSGKTGPECKGLKILFVSKHKHIHHRIVLLHLSIILSSLKKKKKKNYKSLFPIST